MATTENTDGVQADGRATRRVDWRARLASKRARFSQGSNAESLSDYDHMAQRKTWSMGILNDPQTDEVPGSILLLSNVSEYNEPLGLRNAPGRTSASSLPSPYPRSRTGSSLHRTSSVPDTKRTPDGKYVLEPQPDESLNDPLTWPQWRRDLALLSLGFYCAIGGGMTPILAAGFTEVARDFDVSTPQVALTTGLYMMGLGVGSVVLSPTAILFGKRPVYLVAAVCFILTSVWCALSPTFNSLLIARVFMGVAVSSVECLPSATVAEIYFLHEKAYRLGIYTLLLLGGKNLVPLVSAAIIQGLHWRWVFYIVAIIVGFGLCLLFFFVPETFWDRTPRPHRPARGLRRLSGSLPRLRMPSPTLRRNSVAREDDRIAEVAEPLSQEQAEKQAQFDAASSAQQSEAEEKDNEVVIGDDRNSPLETETARHDAADERALDSPSNLEAQLSPKMSPPAGVPINPVNTYTKHYQSQPRKTFVQQLKPWSGRLRRDNWFRVAARPFILFAYPSILWSTLIYSLSIGWLIVLSESVATIYENRASYNFTPLQTGLVYISPFVGGILGTVVAGKVSDIIVRSMARRNGGIYEPEFRLIMAIPIAIFTTVGLMGYGWSAQEHDLWIVPTIFFGFISFGCSLGSTTAITFAVDSYRQYAGEALVTLNFSKNILHGLVFSLFFNRWLDAEGSKDVFVAIGGIQLACLLTTIPMYIYGKRARMWTTRKNLMESF